MKRISIIASFLLLTLVIVDSASAIGRRGRGIRIFRGRQRYSRSYNQGNYSFSGTTPQEVAQQKANLLAELGYGFHPGGGYGGGYREGWGMSTVSAEQARWNTCWGNQCQSARGSATAWSEKAGCWFAINIW